MNRTTRTLLLLAALLMPAAAACAQTPATPAQTKPPASAEKKDEGPRRYETVQFASKLVGATLPYHVVLPGDYASDSAKQRRYPVLYLLHGLGGNAETGFPLARASRTTPRATASSSSRSRGATAGTRTVRPSRTRSSRVTSSRS